MRRRPRTYQTALTTSGVRIPGAQVHSLQARPPLSIVTSIIDKLMVVVASTSLARPQQPSRNRQRNNANHERNAQGQAKQRLEMRPVVRIATFFFGIVR